MPVKHFVNVYKKDQQYGGPEEGGWWYNTYELVLSEGCFTEAFAWFRASKLEEDYPYNGNSSRVNSYRLPNDYAIYVEPQPGKPQPEEHPHYE